MSREWYIRTDKRHMEDTKVPVTAPLTPKEKWQKYKGKYIVYGVAVVFAAMMLIFALPQWFTPTDTDYTLSVVTAAPLSEEALQSLRETAEKLGQDRDGDGAITVQIREIMTDIDPTPVITSFQTGEYSFFVMEQPCYERYVKIYQADGMELFTFLEEQKINGMTYIWGIRALPKNASEKHVQSAKDHLALMQEILSLSKKVNSF